MLFRFLQISPCWLKLAYLFFFSGIFTVSTVKTDAKHRFNICANFLFPVINSPAFFSGAPITTVTTFFPVIYHCLFSYYTQTFLMSSLFFCYRILKHSHSIVLIPLRATLYVLLLNLILSLMPHHEIPLCNWDKNLLSVMGQLFVYLPPFVSRPIFCAYFLIHHKSFHLHTIIIALILVENCNFSPMISAQNNSTLLSITSISDTTRHWYLPLSAMLPCLLSLLVFYIGISCILHYIPA